MTETELVAEITAIEKQFIEAQEFGAGKPLDVDQIMAFYAPDCVLYDVVAPLQFVGEEAIRKDVVDLFGALASLKIALQEIAVAGQDGFAVARCILELTSVGRKGVLSRMTCRLTDCWQKRDGRWRLIHQHASMPGDLRAGTIEFNAKN